MTSASCRSGVYSDAQLISSIILGRPFFQLHRIDAAISGACAVRRRGVMHGTVIFRLADELPHPCSQPLLFVPRRHCTLTGILLLKPDYWLHCSTTSTADRPSCVPQFVNPLW